MDRSWRRPPLPLCSPPLKRPSAMDWTTSPSRWWPGCLASIGSAFRGSGLDADGVDQLIDGDVDADSETERGKQLAGSCTVEKAERKKAAGNGMGRAAQIRE